MGPRSTMQTPKRGLQFTSSQQSRLAGSYLPAALHRENTNWTLRAALEFSSWKNSTSTVPSQVTGFFLQMQFLRRLNLFCQGADQIFQVLQDSLTLYSKYSKVFVPKIFKIHTHTNLTKHVFFFLVCLCFASLCMYHMCTWVPEAREGVGSPELEFNTHELSCM